MITYKPLKTAVLSPNAVIQLTFSELWLMFLQGSLKVMDIISVSLIEGLLKVVWSFKEYSQYVSIIHESLFLK